MTNKSPPTCSRCHKAPPRTPTQRYCLDCHAAWQREHGRKYRDLNNTQKQKADTRTKSRLYTQRGRIEPREPYCQGCFTTHALERHHTSYEDHTAFVVLCRPCHLATHES